MKKLGLWVIVLSFSVFAAGRSCLAEDGSDAEAKAAAKTARSWGLIGEWRLDCKKKDGFFWRIEGGDLTSNYYSPLVARSASIEEDGGILVRGYVWYWQHNIEVKFVKAGKDQIRIWSMWRGFGKPKKDSDGYDRRDGTDKDVYKRCEK